MWSFRLSFKGVKNATLSGKVMCLERQIKETEKKFCSTVESEAAARDAIVLEERQQAVAEFKQSGEYNLATQDFDAGYDKGMEEIFYNIWRKFRGVYYKFLGKDY